MTGQPSILKVMESFFMAAPEPADRRLHVSEHVWRYLRETYTKVIRPEAITVMMGLPIVVDDNLTGGQWQLRENGEVTSTWDMAPAPEGMTVFYTPHSGWLAIRTDLTEEAAS